LPRHELEQDPGASSRQRKFQRRESPSRELEVEVEPSPEMHPQVGDTIDGAVCAWSDDFGGAVVWIADERTAKDADILDRLGVSVLVRCIDGPHFSDITDIYQVSAKVGIPL
jgi:hypothetical protein